MNIKKKLCNCARGRVRQPIAFIEIRIIIKITNFFRSEKLSNIIYCRLEVKNYQKPKCQSRIGHDFL